MTIHESAAPAARTAANIADVVREAARRAPDDAALIGDWGMRTWGQLDAAVEAGAHRFAPLAAGSRVVLALPTGPGLAAALFAAWRAGLVAVPIDPDRTDVDWAAARVGALAVVVPGAPAGRDAATPGDRDGAIVVTAAEVASWWETAAQPSVPDVLSGLSDPIPACRAGGEDLALLARASRPEPPVMLSHRAILAAARAIGGAEPVALLPGDRVLQVLPLFHVVGLVTAFLPAAMAGAAIVVPEAADPAARATSALAAVRQHRVSVLPAEPTLYRQLDRVAGFERALATVRLMTSGSSPLDPVDFAAIRAATGQSVREGYGISEAAAAVASTLMSPSGRVGSVGRPYPGVQIRIDDHLVDEPVATDEPQVQPSELVDLADTADPSGGIGPIAIRGETMFSGYWPDGARGPGADGWFVTGDIGYLDDAGELHLVDRVAETIKVAGFTVYPREVEDVLVTHPLVADAAVVGMPGRAGMTVVAAIVPRPGTRPTDADVGEFAAGLLPPFKRPTDYLLVDVLPRTEVGRLDRVAVRRDYAQARGIVLGAAALAAVEGDVGTAPDGNLVPERAADLGQLGRRLPAASDARAPHGRRGTRDTDDDLF